MKKITKISGFAALPIIIGSAVLAVGILGGLAYEYKDKLAFPGLDKNKILSQISDVTKCGLNTFRVENSCSNNNYRNAYFQCYDGVESKQGDPTSCKSSEIWQQYGNQFCAGHCVASVPASVYEQPGLTCDKGDTIIAYKTTAKTCPASKRISGACAPLNCTTEFHDWSPTDKNQETCKYKKSSTLFGRSRCTESICKADISVRCQKPAKPTVLPTITSFSPKSIYQGADTMIVIFGTNLSKVSAVTFFDFKLGEGYKADFGIVSDTEIDVVGPSFLKAKDYRIDVLIPSGLATSTADSSVFSVLPNPTTTCTDSDGGKNYTVAGKSVESVNGRITATSYDSCQDSNLLNEAYCSSEGITLTEQVSCKTGYSCIDGACLTSIIACTDSKGTVTGADVYGGNPNKMATYTDRCDGSSRLLDFSCSSVNDTTGKGYVAMSNINCLNGCKDGACLATPSIKIIYPNGGGENWILGNKYQVKFQQSGMSGQAKVNLIKQGQENGTACLLKYIEFGKDVDLVDVDLSAGCLNKSEFGDIVPGNYKVNIYAGDSAIQDSSDNYFTISDTYEKPGLTCDKGDTIIAYKTTAKTCPASKRISGACAPLNCTTGSHDWSPTDKNQETCKYKTSSTLFGKSRCTESICKADISVRCQKPAPSIIVLSPNGGENWTLGNKYNVQFSADKAFATGVSISLVSKIARSGAAECILAQNIPVIKGVNTFNLNLESCSNSAFAKLVAGDYKIHIFHQLGFSYDVDAYSDNYFTVSTPPSSIKLTSPIGGENFIAGDPIKINWASSNTPINAVVSITLQDTQGHNDYYLTTSYDNETIFTRRSYDDVLIPMPTSSPVLISAGSYSTNLPKDIRSGQYRVLIRCVTRNTSDYCAGDSSPTYYLGNYFTISTP